MKRIFLILLIIGLTILPVNSQQRTKIQCFQVCQSAFKTELTRCRNDYRDNTPIRTACLDKARLVLNDCLEDCRDEFPSK